MPRRSFFLLIALVALSLGLNLFLLAQLLRIQAQVSRTLAGAGVALDAVALQMEAAANEEVQFTVAVSETVPIQTSIAVSDTFEVPLNTDVPIDTTVRVPINLGLLGEQTFDVPIQATVPVNLVVPIRIDREIPVRTTVPLQIDVPVTIRVAETPFAERLREWAELVRTLRSNVGQQQ